MANSPAPAPAPAAAPEGATIAQYKPLQLPAIQLKEYVPKAVKPKQRYWCGTLPGGAYQNLGVPGCEFVGFTERNERNPSNDTQSWQARAGIVYELDKDQVESILKNLTRKVLRTYYDKLNDGSVKKRAHILNMDSEGYIPNHEQDLPLGCFVYMVEIQAEYTQPNLSYMTRDLGKDTPLMWSHVEHFFMDKFPPPVIPIKK